MSDATKAVFLSYASQDAAAALRICTALRAAGVEVWFDQDALVGGDAWDQKIRGQIGTCALFMPVISAATQERLEGYFRIEWKVAAERTHAMAAARAFLLPIVIDATRDADVHVPAEFRAVQWTKLPGGEVSASFVARVQKLLGGSEVARVSRPVGLEDTGQETRATSPVGRRVPAAAWIAAVVTVALAVGGYVWLQRPAESAPASASNAGAETRPPTPQAQTQDSRPSDQPEADQKSLAVLAFANMSADKDTEYFSDGISEEILNALANNPTLRVAGRTSSFSFKGRNATHVEIGRALNVARVIEGSVRKAGTKVRITVQLINAADGYQLWSQTFDKEMTDIFAVQSEIAATVAQKLAGGSATPATAVTVAAGAETKNLAAYDAYLRGRANPQGSRAAKTAYEEAVELDSDYALAWARLAQGMMSARIIGLDGGDTQAVQARKAAETAVKLAPDLPEARLAMALIRLQVDRDHEAAQRELAIADRLRPSDAEVAEAQAQLEWVRGRWGPPLAARVMRSAELDPLNPNLALSCIILSQIGWFAEAHKLGQRELDLTNNSFPVTLRLTSNLLAWTGDIKGALAMLAAAPNSSNQILLHFRARLHAMLGDFSAATAVYDHVRIGGRSSGPRRGAINVKSWAARLHARQGNAVRAAELYAEALAAAKQFVSDFPELTAGPTHLAVLHADRGEKPEALAALEKAMQLALATRDATQIAESRRMKAFVLATLGEKDAAIAELRTIHATGFAFGYLLRRELEWEPLRGEAKFQQLMKEAEARADAQPRPKPVK